MKFQPRVIHRQQGKRAIHISWHIAGLCTGLLAGVALSAIADMSFVATAGWLLAALFFAVIGFSKRTARYAVFFICAGLIIGLWRGANEQIALQHYTPLFKRTVLVQARVSEDVSQGKKGETRMQLTNVRINNKPLHGKIWASLAPSAKTETSRVGQDAKQQDIKRNDTVVLRGQLREGFGNMAASMGDAQLVRLDQTSKQDAALHVRDWFADGIRRAIPEPQASLGSGFLTGQHSSLPGQLDEQLRIVGLTHAVVASGSNLTILVGCTRRLFGRISKYTATMAGILMTVMFILIAGMSPSMTRAGLVTGLSLAAWYYGRRIHPLVLLPFAAAITVIANPSYLWGDIGWYLSFAAFAGVLVLAPLLQTYFWGKDYKPNVIMEIFIGTTAAQIATMPVILFSFGTYSSYALVANMLVLPLVPLAMLLTLVGGIAGVTLPGIAAIAGWPAAKVMQYMTTVIDRIATLPYAQGEIAYGAVALTCSYLAICVAIAYMWRKTGHNFRGISNRLIGERS